jgi:thiol:disulfide interchange protein DsbC
MRSRLLIIILLSVLTGHSIADTNPPSPSVSDTADLLSNANIEGLKVLPIHGLNMVKAGGKTFFMSDNGRFVITGTLLDVWNRVAVTELDQVEKIANRIDLSKMKLKIDDLGPATIGTGKPQVVVFVDPRCPYCGKVQKQMEAIKGQYTFKLVPIPVLGPESQSLVVKISCLLQTPSKDKARDALMHQAYDTLPSELDSKCDREPVQRALVTAKLFGIDGVPFLIAPDGRTFKGAPENLADWLANKLAPRAEAVQPPSKAAVVPPDSAKTSNPGEDAKQ